MPDAIQTDSLMFIIPDVSKRNVIDFKNNAQDISSLVEKQVIILANRFSDN